MQIRRIWRLMAFAIDRSGVLGFLSGLNPKTAMTHFHSVSAPQQQPTYSSPTPERPDVLLAAREHPTAYVGTTLSPSDAHLAALLKSALSVKADSAISFGYAAERNDPYGPGKRGSSSSMPVEDGLLALALKLMLCDAEQLAQVSSMLDSIAADGSPGSHAEWRQRAPIVADVEYWNFHLTFMIGPEHSHTMNQMEFLDGRHLGTKLNLIPFGVHLAASDAPSLLELNQLLAMPGLVG